jgi:hypothetical protein
MFCKQFEKEVWDYLDGRVDGFSAHLKECPRCRDTLKKAEKLLNILKEGSAPVPPVAYRDSFWPRLKEKIIAQDSHRHPLSLIKLKPIFYTTIGAAAASLILWLSIRTPDSPIFMASSADSPNYIMAPAARQVEYGLPEINYILGPGGEREDTTNYILPGTINEGDNSWAV